MNLQPLLMWRKETARRSPNAIEDLDEFDRSIGCVKLDASIYATGVDFMYNRYSCQHMGEIASEFERRRGIPAGDITPKQPRRNADPSRKLSGKCKIKYDPDDIGKVHLWIPFGENARWETLICANSDMNGMPLWLHQKCMELANIEADAFCSISLQREFRARLFCMIANVTENATKKQRKLLGRALDNPVTAKSLRKYVEMKPEDRKIEDSLHGDDPSDNLGAQHPPADGKVEAGTLAGANRLDSMQLRPRSRPSGTKPRTWAQMQREKGGGVSARNRSAGPVLPKRASTAGSVPRRKNSGLKLKWKGN